MRFGLIVYPVFPSLHSASEQLLDHACDAHCGAVIDTSIVQALIEPTHEPCALRSYIVPQSLPAFGGQLRMQVGRDRNMGSSLFPSD